MGAKWLSNSAFKAWHGMAWNGMEGAVGDGNVAFPSAKGRSWVPSNLLTDLHESVLSLTNCVCPAGMTGQAHLHRMYVGQLFSAAVT